MTIHNADLAIWGPRCNIPAVVRESFKRSILMLKQL